MRRLLRHFGLLFGLAACTGSIEHPGQVAAGSGGRGSVVSGGRSGGAGGTRGGGSGGAEAIDDTTLPMPLRRLTSVEHRNTLRDLLGTSDGLDAVDFPDDGRGASGFVTGDGAISLGEAQTIANGAEKAAAIAVKRIGSLAACTPSGDGVACARQIVTQFGARAYRRPLLDAEASELVTLYQRARTTHQQDFAGAIGLVVQAMLQSPSFLYHWELGPQPAHAESADRVRLAPYEIASRLSYYLWASMPDAELFAAAANNALATAEQVTAQARRLLADPRASDAIASFYAQWLELDQLIEHPKDPALVGYVPSLLGSMRKETEAFVRQVVVDRDGSLDELLTARYSFLDGDLAKVYGVAAPATAFSRVDLDPKQRAGILTHASFMALSSGAQETSPVLRGKRVRLSLLCDVISPPPDSVPPLPADPTKSVRERFAMHTNSPSCAGCHRVMDPIGWGFERYDPLGRYRESDATGPIDAHGVLESLQDGTKRNFEGASELAGILVESPRVHECFARQWLRFALGRRDVPADDPAIGAAVATFEKQGRKIRELMVAIAGTASFATRSPAAGEVLK